MLRQVGHAILKDAATMSMSTMREGGGKVDPKRMKGFGKKLLLRSINRNIIPRIAKRATIGIPILGLYFVQRILRGDVAESTNKENSDFIRRGFMLAATLDTLDMFAQTTMLATMVSNMIFPDVPEGSNMPELYTYVLKTADKTSLSTAVASSALGTYLGYKKDLIAIAKEEGVVDEKTDHT